MTKTFMSIISDLVDFAFPMRFASSVRFHIGVVCGLFLMLGIGSVCAEGPKKLTVITTEALNKYSGEYSLADYVSHREAQGILVRVMTVEEIYSNQEGIDKPEKIRNYIKSVHESEGVDYFMIVGNGSLVPSRELWTADSIKKEYPILSDYYYSALEGDFNENKNKRWGEYPADKADETADVFVGRVPAKNAAQMANYIYKIITYDRSPPNASYHSKAFAWTTPDVGQLGEFKSISDLVEMTLERQNNIDSRAYALWRMNTGNYGFILAGGHGLRDMSCELNVSDMDGLKNKDRFFFYASISCFSGDYLKEGSYNERLLVGSRDGGAIAAVLGTHEGIPPQICWCLDALPIGHFGQGIKDLGGVFRTAQKSLFNGGELGVFSNNQTRWTLYSYHLLGDPTLTLKMKDAKASDLIVDFEDSKNSEVVDRAGNFAPGKIEGGVTVVDGKIGKAVTFDGQSGVIKFDDSLWAPMGNQAALGVQLWINPTASNKAAGIISKGEQQSTFSLRLNEEGILVFSANKGNVANDTGKGEWKFKTTVKFNEWQHIAATYDPKTQKVLLYLNGVQDAEYPVKLYFGYTKEPVVIGKAINGSSEEYFSGSIDQVEVWSRYLTPEEIAKAAKVP